MKITLSVIKGEVGSLVGHHPVHPDQIKVASAKLSEAKNSGLLIDYHVTSAGDDLQLIMTQRKGQKNAKCTRFDGPPRVLALGFQLCDGRLIGPADLFDDPASDRSRNMASEIADYLRRHGPFMPARLGLEEMEYTTLSAVLRKLETRFKPTAEVLEALR